MRETLYSLGESFLCLLRRWLLCVLVRIAEDVTLSFIDLLMVLFVLLVLTSGI